MHPAEPPVAPARNPGVDAVIGWCGSRLIDAVMLVLAIAAVGKALDPGAFVRSLASWTLVPHGAHAVLAIAVPAAEAACAAAWFLSVGRARALVGAVFLLTLFSGVYAIYLAVGERSQCACLGKIAAFEMATAQARAVLLRNGLMLAAILLGSVARARHPLKASATRRMSAPARPASDGGWTLLEVLVIIAVLAVLLAITLPMIRGVRLSAKDTVSLANLRSHASVFAAYAGDYRDFFPCVTDPARPTSDISCERITLPDSPYFVASAAWNVGLADAYYGGDCFQASFYSPGYTSDWHDDGSHPVFTSYWFSCAFLAEPAFWRPETRVGPAQWRGSKYAEVAFPSKKVLLIDIYAWARRPADNDMIALADGAAVRSRAHARLSQYPNGDGNFPGSVHSWSAPGTHTLGGTGGRDIR